MLKTILQTASQCSKGLLSVKKTSASLYNLDLIRTTVIVERMYPPKLAKIGKKPSLQARNKVLKFVCRVHDEKTADISCILTDFVEGVGIRGDLVTVKRRLFRNKLYPAGLAVYASPENIERFKKDENDLRNQKESRLGVFAEMTLKQLSGMYLRIPMSGDNPWILNKTHIRVALRKASVEVKDECITLPTQAITEPGEITFQVTINGLKSVLVRGMVLLHHKDPKLNQILDLPPTFQPTVRIWKKKVAETVS
ncbi:hypothetical protein C0Q70_03180 [Pomacea canaliculata]|uniref:Large ribosomal subunit protein bL9m n=1 Tax=Pomacea canaliculata TaxID=400727 RepID=A0A2T7PS06_POMCA|nr:39S ribosomal protein L9, mitochondrial-like [Pomacea canaliculata]PVD36205.1 hypothetical protein C0Q70_03180 [Pomacea canaliculata]